MPEENKKRFMAEDQVVVYAQPSKTSAILRRLQIGEEILLESELERDGKKWCKITLSDGAVGHMTGSAKCLSPCPIIIDQDSVELLEAPVAGAKALGTSERGSGLQLIGMTIERTVLWLRVRTSSGDIGYIAANTKWHRPGSGPIAPAAASSRLMKYWPFGCLAVVLLGLLSLAGIWMTTSLEDRRSDEISSSGGQEKLDQWLNQAGLLERIRQSGIPYMQCASPSVGHSFAFLTWVYGDDIDQYSDTRRIDFGIAESSDRAHTWNGANSVLIIKLATAGTETRQLTQVAAGSRTPTANDYKDGKIKIYSAEAWLIDKPTHQCLGHQIFSPGADPDTGYHGDFMNPLARVYDVRTLRFRAVSHAIDWAKALH